MECELGPFTSIDSVPCIVYKNYMNHEMVVRYSILYEECGVYMLMCFA